MTFQKTLLDSSNNYADVNMCTRTPGTKSFDLDRSRWKTIGVREFYKKVIMHVRRQLQTFAYLGTTQLISRSTRAIKSLQVTSLIEHLQDKVIQNVVLVRL